MGILEIIFAIILIIACVFIIIVVLMKDTKTKMSQTISGTSADSYFGKNSGRTKDAMLNKATIIAAIVFFVLSLTVNLVNLKFGKNSDSDTTSSISSGTSSSDENSDVDDVLEGLIASIEESDLQDESDADTSVAESDVQSDVVSSEIESGADSSNAESGADNSQAGANVEESVAASAEVYDVDGASADEAAE